MFALLITLSWMVAAQQRRVLYPADKAKLVISASPKYDPGVHDWTGMFGAAVESHLGMPMSNAVYTPNDNPASPYDSEGITTWDDGYPAPQDLGDYHAWWDPRDGIARHPVLIVEDMEIGYAKYVDFVLPNCERLLAKFREYDAPIIWTNWVRRAEDGNWGALDRFYGPEGTSNEENPMFIYGKEGTDTLPRLAPLNDDEYSRTIRSLHLSKFADLDQNGRLILYNMLKNWGVDTIVLTGAWTDDCILATVYDAVDKYDFDVILVEDAVATTTLQHGNALKISRAGLCIVTTTQDVLSLLDQSFGDEQAGYLVMPPAYRARTSLFARITAHRTHAVLSIQAAVGLTLVCSLLSAALVAGFYRRRRFGAAEKTVTYHTVAHEA